MALAKAEINAGLGATLSASVLSQRDFALNLLSGLCLMFALRCLARDAGSAWIALFLLAAGIAHAADIVRRWQRAAYPATASACERIAKKARP